MSEEEHQATYGDQIVVKVAWPDGTTYVAIGPTLEDLLREIADRHRDMYGAADESGGK